MTQCPQCNDPVRPEDSFCENCGFNLRQDLPLPDQPESWIKLPPSIGSWRTLRWIIACGVLTLIILCNLCGAGANRFIFRQPDAAQVVEVPVEVVVTATPSPTSTNTPGPSPTPTNTGTPTPTKIPLPTSTPVPTTAPETILKPGDKWYGEGMALWLVDAVEIYPDSLRITLVIKNDSKEPILFQMRPDMYRMQSNLNDVVYLGHNFVNGGVALKSGEELILTNRGVFGYNLANEDVSYVVVEVDGIPRIGRARWRVEIPH